MGLLEDGVKSLIGSGMNGVLEQGLEGLVGDNLKGIVELIISKLKQNISVADIAKQVKQPENLVSQICDVANKMGLDTDVETILKQVMKLPGLKK